VLHELGKLPQSPRMLVLSSLVDYSRQSDIYMLELNYLRTILYGLASWDDSVCFGHFVQVRTINLPYFMIDT